MIAILKTTCHKKTAPKEKVLLKSRRLIRRYASEKRGDGQRDGKPVAHDFTAR